MKTKYLTAFVVTLVTVPIIGFAQGAGQGMARMATPQVDFATADANSDGGITSEEWVAYAETMAVTQRSTMIGARADELIAAGDANGDSLLNRDELIAGMTALRDQRRSERGERGEGRRGDWMRGHHDNDEARGDRGGLRGMIGGMFGHGDRSGRGFEDMRGGDRMEPGDRAERAFEWIDRNGDDRIDAEELAQMQDFMQRRMERRGNN